MQCPHCKQTHTKNTWVCRACGKSIDGGVVFITGISGSCANEKLIEVVKEATQSEGHSHAVKTHDVGTLMYEHALEDDPDVRWDRILDASPSVLRLLRALAFQDISREVASSPNDLHLIDIHLCFRWKAYLTKGFEPRIINSFIPNVRCFINVIEDLPKIQKRLQATAWGKRKILELLVWRDEELLLTDILAGISGRVNAFAVAAGEPPTIIERLIWHPELRKAYLSFPITGIKKDKAARRESEPTRPT
jgi:adenylate kinase